jgi:uncharacterized protein
MKPLRLMLVMLLAMLMLAPAHAQKFPALTGRVVDAANLLSPEQEAQLTQLSADIEKASSRQFVVATIPDLQGYPIEDYGYQLGRAWKIGQSEANNGILLIVAPAEKKVRIEVGYGLEPIMTDALSAQIIRDSIIPRFRTGDMAGGIMAGAAQIGEQMKLPLEAAEARAKAQLDKAAPNGGKGGENEAAGLIVGVIFVFILIVFFFVSVVARRGRGRSYRGGSGVGQVILWSVLNAAANSSRGGGGSDWGGGGGGGGGGFSGGGGSFGGGGASGSW